MANSLSDRNRQLLESARCQASVMIRKWNPLPIEVVNPVYRWKYQCEGDSHNGRMIRTRSTTMAGRLESTAWIPVLLWLNQEGVLKEFPYGNRWSNLILSEGYSAFGGTYEANWVRKKEVRLLNFRPQESMQSLSAAHCPGMDYSPFSNR